MSALAIREAGAALLIEVQVVPRASRERIGPWVGERLKVQLTAPPVDGEANLALVQILAKALGIPRRQVTIVSGETGRKKTIRVEGTSRAALLALVEQP